MIGLLHGYLLEGSGSNLWTRCVVEALCREGETVHLFCQEPHPDRYDCIAEAYAYHPDGAVRTLLSSRDVPYAGRCIMHKPVLGPTLPVFVWDRYEEFPDPVPMITMADDALEEYIARNVAVVERVVRERGLAALHANHAALIAEVAARASARTGIPFAVMPHGSELEYALRRDERFARMATGALTAAARVFVHGDEMRNRVARVLPDVPLEGRATTLPLGVHTWQFEPVPRERRREKVGRLLVSLAGKPRGRRLDQRTRMLEAAHRTTSTAELRALFAGVKYDAKLPDEAIEEKIEQVDWEHDAILLYVGRLISAKGVQSGIAALPLLLAEDPGIRLLVVGHGPLREPLETFLWALEHGDRALVERIVSEGQTLEGNPHGEGGHAELGQVGAFFRDLEQRGELDRYFALAREHVRQDRVLFMGYLTHTELQHLFPCCDAGIFPSVVKEAGPLVFLEALASGCFPLGTYFGGMRASIDALADVLPPYILDAMKLDVDCTVTYLVQNAATALRFGTRYKDVLSRTAQDRYDWTSVARKLRRELEAAVAEAPVDTAVL